MKPRDTRISAPDEAAAFAARVRAAGRTVVLANGVFDLLHAGHIRYLRQARALGDALIVAVTSDRSVRARQGPDRPLNPEHERAELILALAAVDAVVVVDQDTAPGLVSRIQPDILVKAAGEGADEAAGEDIVEQRGGRVVRIDPAPGFSTTSLVDRVRRLR